MPEVSLPAVRGGAPLATQPAPLGMRAREVLAALRRYAPVEARRNRVLFAGLPLVILVSLPFSAAIAAAAGMPAAQGVYGALAAWAAVGLPLAAVLLGGVAGAGLRGPAEEAEASFPLSPRVRSFGALLTTSSVFASGAALVAALSAVAARGAAEEVLAGLAVLGRWESTAGYLGASAVVAAASLSWLLTVSFTAAYVASHAVLGAVVALAGAGLLLVPSAAGIALYAVHAPHLAMPFLAAAALSTVVSAATAGLTLGLTASGAARSARRSLGALVLSSLLPLAGTPLTWRALWNAPRHVVSELDRVWSGMDRSLPNRTPAEGILQKNLRDERRVDLARGFGGRLVRMKDDGSISVVLLPGPVPALGDMLARRRGEYDAVSLAFRDNDGRFWAETVVRASGRPTARTVWTGDGGGPLARYAALPPDMALQVYGGRAAVAPTSNDEHATDYVLLDPAAPPVLRPGGPRPM